MIRKPQQRAAESTHRMANRLRRYFAPASIMPPPGVVRTVTGNRNTVVTARNSTNNAPDDAAVVYLKNGVATWNFKTKFNFPPIVIAVAIGKNKNGPQELYAQGLGSAVGAIIHSTDTSDNRAVYLHATGYPN